MNIVNKIVALLVLIPILVAFSGQCLSDSAPIAFEIFPYLSNIEKDVATINWRLKSKGKSYIKYGITLDCEQNQIDLDHENYQHNINLIQLTPDTLYYYNVNNVYKGSFRTDKVTNKFRFVALGHSHGTERFNHYPDRLLLGKVNELDPDFIVHMGDATFYSNVDDFKEYYFDEFDKLIGKTPIYISPGNHDSGWPFVYGLNLTTFKELFPYPYPQEILKNKKEAFYSIVKGNVQFLFLSYTAPLGPGSLQRQWLKSVLQGSIYDFNIIIYGGAQSAYYNENSFLDFISNYNVDLVLKGDGYQYANEFLKEYKGIPIYFVGTSGGDAHSFLYVEHEEDHLSLKRLSAKGDIISTDWIYTKQKHDQKVPLSISPENIKTNKTTTTISFDFKDHLNSERISGLQFLMKSRKGKRAIVYAYITPSDISTDLPNEGGFRTQYHEFAGGTDNLVTISFPKQNPLKGGNYKIKKIRLMIDVASEQIQDFEFSDIYLY